MSVQSRAGRILRSEASAQVLDLEGSIPEKRLENGRGQFAVAHQAAQQRVRGEDGNGGVRRLR
jgi:hypothetical protein